MQGQEVHSSPGIYGTVPLSCCETWGDSRNDCNWIKTESTDFFNIPTLVLSQALWYRITHNHRWRMHQVYMWWSVFTFSSVRRHIFFKKEGQIKISRSSARYHLIVAHLCSVIYPGMPRQHPGPDMPNFYSLSPGGVGQITPPLGWWVAK